MSGVIQAVSQPPLARWRLTPYLTPSPTEVGPLPELFNELQEALGDSYRLERELGGGGMSHVFLASEASLNRHVVIKVLPPDFASEVSAARFKREMEVTAQLHHPHILPVLTAGARDRIMYYVMPYIEGESLRHRLTRERQLPIADALRILREIADALAFAHRHGVVHRDVKPENILLEDGHAVLADFGVARALLNAGGTNLTGTGTSVGTPGYMAPEQMTGERNIDARSDVYALALVGYEMLAGHPPFSGSSAKAIIAAHLTTPPVPLTEIRAEVPVVASNAIARALSKEPDARFQTAGAFRDELEAAVMGAAVAAAERPGRARSMRSLAIAIAAIVVLAVALGTYFYRDRSSRRLDADLLVVAPFNVLSADLALWKEGLVDVLTRNLDGAGPLRTVSPSIVVQDWNGHADRQTAGALAHRTGAGLAVFGTLEKFGRDSVRAAVTMFDANSGALLSDFRRSEHADRMDRLVDSLTVTVLRELGRTRPISEVRFAGIGSSSLPALKAFLQGEQYFRRTSWDSATMSYERAVALDSTFALALFRAGTVRGWINGIRDTAAAMLVSRAASHLQGLAPRDSLIILSDSIGRSFVGAGENLQRTPDLPDRLRRLFAITEVLEARYPGDPEAWYSIGEARFHHGTRLGRRQSRRSILDAFDRSIAADSGFAPAYIHAIELAYELGTVEDALRYVRAYNRLSFGEIYAPAMKLVERITDPALAATSETQQMLDTMSTAALQTAVIPLVHAVDSTEAVVRVNAEVRSRRSGFRFGGSPSAAAGFGVDLLTYRGYVAQARQLLAAHPENSALRFTPYTIAEAAWFDAWPADTLRMLVASVPDSNPVWNAVLAVVMGDTSKMLSARAPLSVRASGGGSAAREAMAILDARLALARGDSIAALRALDSVHISANSDPLGRMMKADLLLARGRTAEALDVVRDGFVCPCLSRVLLSLLRGRIAEAAGERELAIESYGLVTAAWRKPDPELQRFVEQAKAGLARLGGDQKTPRRL